MNPTTNTLSRYRALGRGNHFTGTGKAQKKNALSLMEAHGVVAGEKKETRGQHGMHASIAPPATG